MNTTKQQRDEAWDELLELLRVMTRDESAAGDGAVAAEALARDLRKATEEREAELVTLCVDARPWLAKALADGAFDNTVSPSMPGKILDRLHAAAKGARNG